MNKNEILIYLKEIKSSRHAPWPWTRNNAQNIYFSLTLTLCVCVCVCTYLSVFFSFQLDVNTFGSIAFPKPDKTFHTHTLTHTLTHMQTHNFFASDNFCKVFLTLQFLNQKDDHSMQIKSENQDWITSKRKVF